MTSSASSDRSSVQRLAFSVLSAACVVGLSHSAWGAERSSPLTERATTQLVVRLSTDETIAVQSRFQERPPTLHIKFPDGRVIGSLPERSVIRRGAIEEIRTAYGDTMAPTQARWINVLSIRLRAPYPYLVRSEAGQVVITIEHPATVASDAIELGLPGGTIISGVFLPAFSERFQAMQEALMRAGPPRQASRPKRRPAPASLSLNTAPRAIRTAAPALTSAQAPAPAPKVTTPPQPVPSARPVGQRSSYAIPGWWWSRWWWTLAALGAIGALSALWWVGRWEGWWERRTPARARLPQRSSATRILDQLVWRAFERQGYELVQAVESSEPTGTLRVMAKAGVKSALLCVGDGSFFEKTLVEQLLRAMRGLQLAQGYLIAPGAFTVPAQRYAKANGVALMSREQLIELLSAGAISEHTAAQLEHIRTQLDDAKETLTQYAQQLDVIRRQRNEASWFLAEARTTASRFEQELAEMTQHVRQSQEEAVRWQQIAEQHHKQWEESQWYLGEAKACHQHQEEQFNDVQDAVAQLDTRLKETQAQLEEMRRLWQDTQQALEVERAYRQSLEAERVALREHGERRKAPRLSRSDIQVEVHGPQGGTFFEGRPHDLSRTGIGLDSPQLNDHLTIIQVRLRLPGLDRPIEATGRIVWQQQDLSVGKSRIGCEFDALPSDAADVFEQTLERLS